MPVTPSSFSRRARATLTAPSGLSAAVANVLLPRLDLSAILGGVHNNAAGDVRLAASDTLAELTHNSFDADVPIDAGARGCSNFWLVTPAANRSGEYLYTSLVEAVTGSVYVVRTDLRTMASTKALFVSGWRPAGSGSPGVDDHNVCAILDPDGDGRMVFIASEHSQSGFVLRRLATAHDLTTLGTAVDLAAASGEADSAYAETFVRDGKIFIQYRERNLGGATWGRKLFWSTNAALTTWSTPVYVVTNGADKRPYSASYFDPATDRLHLFFNVDNIIGTAVANGSPIYHGYIDFGDDPVDPASGSVVRTSDGTSLGALGTAVLTPANATACWTVGNRVGWPYHARVCNGQPICSVAAFDDNNTAVQECYVARWSGSAWVQTHVAAAALTDFDTTAYSPGCVFSNDGLTLYAGQGAKGSRNITRYTTADNWATVSAGVQVSKSAGLFVHFPVVPQNADARCPVFADVGDYVAISVATGGVPQIMGGRRRVLEAVQVPSVPTSGTATFDAFAGSGSAASDASAAPGLLYQFDAGADCAARLSAAPTLLSNRGAFTVTCLFRLRTADAGARRYVWSGWALSGGTGAAPMLRYNASNQLEVIYCTGAGVQQSTLIFTDIARPAANVWTHLAFVFDRAGANQVACWHNGVKSAVTATLSANHNTNTITGPLWAFGTEHSTEVTVGEMAYLRAYDTALSADRIKAENHFARTAGAVTLEAVANGRAVAIALGGAAMAAFTQKFFTEEDG